MTSVPLPIFTLETVASSSPEGGAPRPGTYYRHPTETRGYVSEKWIDQGTFKNIYLGKQWGPAGVIGDHLVLAITEMKKERDIVNRAERIAFESLRGSAHTNICVSSDLFTCMFQNGIKAQVLVMPYYKGGALDRYLQEDRLPEETFRAIEIGIGEGLLYLHGENILHGDMKPENILLDDNNVPKIADFGLSVKTCTLPGGDLRLQTVAGTPEYLPPEMMRLNFEKTVWPGFTASQKEGCIKESDKWAYGCILYAIAAQSFDFPWWGVGDFPKPENRLRLECIFEGIERDKDFSFFPKPGASKDRVIYDLLRPRIKDRISLEEAVRRLCEEENPDVSDIDGASSCCVL